MDFAWDASGDAYRATLRDVIATLRDDWWLERGGGCGLGIGLGRHGVEALPIRNIKECLT